MTPKASLSKEAGRSLNLKERYVLARMAGARKQLLVGKTGCKTCGLVTILLPFLEVEGLLGVLQNWVGGGSCGF